MLANGLVALAHNFFVDDFDDFGVGDLVFFGAFVEFIEGGANRLFGGEAPGGEAVVDVALESAFKFAVEGLALFSF